MIFPRLNSQGGKLPELWKTVSEICEVLPSLNVQGDNETIAVNSHSGGKIIRAINRPSSGGAASVSDVAIVYDGPWSFTTTVNTQGNTIFRVKGGYFNRNGLFVPMNLFGGGIDDLRYYDFNLNNIVTDNYIYNVHIYQEWVQSSKAWRAAEVRVTHDAPPQGVPLSAENVFGYCLLGWLRRSGDAETGFTYNWECYGQAVPTMFVVGECRTGEH